MLCPPIRLTSSSFHFTIKMLKSGSGQSVCDQSFWEMLVVMSKTGTCCTRFTHVPDKEKAEWRISFFLPRKNTLFGSSNTPLTRWLPAEYQDKIAQPKGWDPTRRVNRRFLPLVIHLVTAVYTYICIYIYIHMCVCVHWTIYCNNILNM